MVSATNPNPKSKNVYHIGGLQVEFPYQPYGSQFAFMGRVISILNQAQREGHCHASATGTGKSLSLLCSCLAWQHHYKSKEDHLKPAPEATTDPLAYGGGFVLEDISPSSVGERTHRFLKWFTNCVKLHRGNIEDIARDAGSVDIEEDVLDKLEMELQQLCSTSAAIYQPLYEMTQVLTSWMEQKKHKLEKRDFHHYVWCWTGDNALGELEEANISKQCFPILLECATKLALQRRVRKDSGWFRYIDTLKACALDVDVSFVIGGDMAYIGDKAISPVDKIVADKIVVMDKGHMQEIPMTFQIIHLQNSVR
ncbi:hypothetical protein ACSQ67_026190 [Phaseolus vulgaris]